MGRRNARLIARDQAVSSPSLTRELPLVFKKASGCHIWDEDGRKYLDLTASVAVASVGHTDKDVRKAMIAQMRNGFHCCYSDFYARAPLDFTERFLSHMGKGYPRVFLSNSGTEATEAAYKIARFHTRRKRVIAFKGAFHGRTMGSLSMTNSKPVQREGFGPFLPVDHVPYPYAYKLGMEKEEASAYCLSELEDALRRRKDEVAAVFIEPVQGEGGYVVPPKSFMEGVRRLCDSYDTLLADDEVQAGTYRTGSFMAISNFGVEPDIAWFAKGLADGMPIGVTTAREGLWDWPPGAHANTFGGNLVSCAAGSATLDILKRKRLGDNARKIGAKMLKRLEEMEEGGKIAEARGLGLMIGVEVEGGKRRDHILRGAMGRGLLLLPAGDSAIRMCPPLTITQEQAMEALGIFEGCL